MSTLGAADDEPDEEDETQRYLLGLWTTVLRIDVGLDDDFFACGGNSMAAIRMLTQVLSRWETEIDLDRFFGEPTVRTLSELLADRA